MPTVTDAITVLTELSGDSWSITGTVTLGTILPPDIFMYENTGTTTLGKYIGVCNLNELMRIQVWADVAIPKFGNRFVRTSQAKITVPVSVDPGTIAFNMIATAKVLKVEMAAASSSTTVYPI